MYTGQAIERPGERPDENDDYCRNQDRENARVQAQGVSAHFSDSLKLFLGRSPSELSFPSRPRLLLGFRDGDSPRKLGGTAVNWFSEKLGVLPTAREDRRSTTPNPDTDAVLTLRENVRGVDGPSPNVGVPGRHTLNGCKSKSSPTVPSSTFGSNPSSSCTSSIDTAAAGAGGLADTRFFKICR